VGQFVQRARLGEELKPERVPGLVALWGTVWSGSD
jgi:hypothetical protein